MQFDLSEFCCTTRDPPHPKTNKYLLPAHSFQIGKNDECEVLEKVYLTVLAEVTKEEAQPFSKKVPQLLLGQQRSAKGWVDAKITSLFQNGSRAPCKPISCDVYRLQKQQLLTKYWTLLIMLVMSCQFLV